MVEAVDCADWWCCLSPDVGFLTLSVPSFTSSSFSFDLPALGDPAAAFDLDFDFDGGWGGLTSAFKDDMAREGECGTSKQRAAY